MLRWLLFFENYASYYSPSIADFHIQLYIQMNLTEGPNFLFPTTMHDTWGYVEFCTYIVAYNFSFMSIHSHHLNLSALQTVSICRVLDDLDFKRRLRALKCVFSHKGEKHSVKEQISFNWIHFLISFQVVRQMNGNKGRIKDIITRTNNSVVPQFLPMKVADDFHGTRAHAG